MSNSCQPLNFYFPNRDEILDRIESEKQLKRVGYSILALFTLLSAPLLVFPPFFMNKLNTTTRKIIAMIILSDSVTSVGTLMLYVGDYQAVGQGGPLACFVVSQIVNIGFNCSLVWSVPISYNRIKHWFSYRAISRKHTCLKKCLFTISLRSTQIAKIFRKTLSLR